MNLELRFWILDLFWFYFSTCVFDTNCLFISYIMLLANVWFLHDQFQILDFGPWICYFGFWFFTCIWCKLSFRQCRLQVNVWFLHVQFRIVCNLRMACPGSGSASSFPIPYLNFRNAFNMNNCFSNTFIGPIIFFLLGSDFAKSLTFCLR